MNSSASRKVAGHRSAFSQTCNLLSQYVKEKKPVGDLSLGILGGQHDLFRPSMMNLFPKENPAGEGPILTNSKPMDLFPQQACFASQSSEPKFSELTIFYGGQVIVFNKIPAQKAKEIMELANRGVSQKSTSIAPAVDNSNTNNTSPIMKNAADNTRLAPSGQNKLAISFKNSQQVQECAQQSTTSIVTDLPIARKASLHRFLEKRKDRIKGRAPYNTSKPGDDVPLKAVDERNSWLGLAAAPPS